MDLTVALVGAAAIVALTGVSAFFSSSELAVFSIASHRVDSLVAGDVPGARALAALRGGSHRFLVTALVSNNVANIAAASVATAAFVRYGFSEGEAATGSTIATSLFVIVFGEIAPKSYAVANAEKHALRVSRPVVAIQRVVGIATLEDVVEGVVGELVARWETDHVDVVAPGAAVVRGWAAVAHLNEALSLDLPSEGGVETIAGLISQRLGRAPKKGDRIALGEVTLTVAGATVTRVTRVRVGHSGPGDGDDSVDPA